LGHDPEEVTVGEAFLADAISANGLGNLVRYETSKWNMYLKAAKRLDELRYTLSTSPLFMLLSAPLLM